MARVCGLTRQSISAALGQFGAWRTPDETTCQAYVQRISPYYHNVLSKLSRSRNGHPDARGIAMEKRNIHVGILSFVCIVSSFGQSLSPKVAPEFRNIDPNA